MYHFKFNRIGKFIIYSPYLLPKVYLSVFFNAIPVPPIQHATDFRQVGTECSAYRPGVYPNLEFGQHPLPCNYIQQI